MDARRDHAAEEPVKTARLRGAQRPRSGDAAPLGAPRPPSRPRERPGPQRRDTDPLNREQFGEPRRRRVQAGHATCLGHPAATRVHAERADVPEFGTVRCAASWFMATLRELPVAVRRKSMKKPQVEFGPALSERLFRAAELMLVTRGSRLRGAASGSSGPRTPARGTEEHIVGGFL